MQIIHIVNDFLFTIFPKLLGANKEDIVSELTKFFSIGGHLPEVTVENDKVTITLNTKTLTNEELTYNRAIAFCEAGNYTEAKPIIAALIAENPVNSEYHRVMGQILSDEGNQEEAINCLIDSLRWNPNNGWALLMMGNIFAKYKDDLLTAMKYYDQALLSNPNDNITMNNIGGNLLQQGKVQAAKKYFEAALMINNQYPNTHYALSMVAEIENDLESAFYSASQSIKLCDKKQGLYQRSIDQLISISKKILLRKTGNSLFTEFKNKLESEGGIEIDIIEDGSIPSAAKIEFAENYNRSKHTIRYKPNYPAVEHLIMHELAHLELVINARKSKQNKLFISTQENKNAFIKSIGSTVQKLKRSGISDISLSRYLDALFDGINSQIFNAPVDLFIEDLLYAQYPELRAYQFLSVYSILKDSVTAVTDKKIIESSPKEIVTTSKVYNLVNAMQFKELFGVDIIQDFKATSLELKQAKELFEEYLQYRTDKEPGEEYELVQHWAEDLNIDKYFSIVMEDEYRSKHDKVDQLLNSIVEDPYDLGGNQEEKVKEMDQFHKAEQELGINMAVVMFMVEALQYFEKQSKSDIKAAAFEIAMQGTHGYNPDGQTYRLSNIPNKVFTGYQILAFYYVSWSLVLPEMVKDLHLPYDQEYKLALRMHQPNKDEKN